MAYILRNRVLAQLFKGIAVRITSIKAYITANGFFLTLAGTRSIGNKTPNARGSDAPWRAENGLPANRSSFGPLTNLPDYTFLDGRPTPLGVILLLNFYKGNL